VLAAEIQRLGGATEEAAGTLRDLRADLEVTSGATFLLEEIDRAEALLEQLSVAPHPMLASVFAPDGAPERRPGGGPGPLDRLTPRELRLLHFLPSHLSYAEIGERLFISVNTVKTNLKALYRKLDARTRAEAVEAAARAGLLASATASEGATAETAARH